jgi:hypothetical protein
LILLPRWPVPSCLPLVVEVVETEEKIQEILPALDRMIGGGLVTLERVRVILYRPGDLPESERGIHPSRWAQR